VAVERAGIVIRLHEDEHDPRAASYGLEAVARLGHDSRRVYNRPTSSHSPAPGQRL